MTCMIAGLAFRRRVSKTYFYKDDLNLCVAKNLTPTSHLFIVLGKACVDDDHG